MVGRICQLKKCLNRDRRAGLLLERLHLLLELLNLVFYFLCFLLVLLNEVFLLLGLLEVYCRGQRVLGILKNLGLGPRKEPDVLFTLRQSQQALLSGLEPAELTFGVGTATFFENRRRLDVDGRYVGMGPNPQNHTDRDVPVLRIAKPGGGVRALVFGAACHNVTFGGQ